MDVIIELKRCKSFELEIWFFDTVLEIKKKIQKYHGFPVDRQILSFKGKVLLDDRDTEYYTILQRSRLQLVLKPEHNDRKDISEDKLLDH